MNAGDGRERLLPAAAAAAAAQPAAARAGGPPTTSDGRPLVTRRHKTAADWAAEMDRAVVSRGAWRGGGRVMFAGVRPLRTLPLLVSSGLILTDCLLFLGRFLTDCL